MPATVSSQSLRVALTRRNLSLPVFATLVFVQRPHLLQHFGPRTSIRLRTMGGATLGCGGGVNVPLTFGTREVQGVQRGGPMNMIFASTADSFLFSTIQVTYISAFCLKTER